MSGISIYLLYPAPGLSTDGEQENAPDLAAEGVHFIWSTRPGSQARAASRQALCASRAKLGREPATPTLATCSDPPQRAALGTPA